MSQAQSEPNLTFKISDVNEFHCSECGATIASTSDRRLVVLGLADLIDVFKDHVSRCHRQENPGQNRPSCGLTG
jgi:hypothetical protein